MIVHVEITSTLNFQIEQPVTREQLEHVIEERHPGFDPRDACSIDAEQDGDVRLFCLSTNLCRSRLCLFSFHNSSSRLCESWRLCAKLVCLCQRLRFAQPRRVPPRRKAFKDFSQPGDQ